MPDVTWDELAEENYRAAHALRQLGLMRASISRSYYSAYAALTATFIAMGMQTNFKHGENPSHAQVLGLLEHLRKRMSANEVTTLRRLTRRLQHARVEADYQPGRTLDPSACLDRLRDSANVISILGMNRDA